MAKIDLSPFSTESPAPYDTAARALERVRKLASLPWARQVPERVELADTPAPRTLARTGSFPSILSNSVR